MCESGSQRQARKQVKWPMIIRELARKMKEIEDFRETTGRRFVRNVESQATLSREDWGETRR